ncbi:MAG: 4-amino-4-deoxy-L-arabinose transferase, partial [Marmoricola sp.]|nr:4-amino-4-deoxy-L-arabinose transferase [Marmoricola sp.]
MSIPVQIRDHVLARPVTLGSGRLVCIDGPSGSGKTTVARQLAGLLPATTIHTDELCPGWEGLPLVPGVLARLLEPLAAGRPGSYREWDWIGGGPGDDRTVQP